ncbi:MAG: 3'-5' exonuclease [Candidatus Hodarchaeales archaeon]
MSKQDRRMAFYPGYRSWFNPFRYNQRLKIFIFILDYETQSQWEDTYESYSQYENRDQKKPKLINGIQIYFLDEDNRKRKAFLRHEPYFYLLLEEGLSRQETNSIMAQIKEIGEKQVINVKKDDYFDADNLTFLVKKPFIKVTVDRPGSVPNLRAKTEEINGVKEWREGDVLFHHRCAIDHNVRIGAWYEAQISGGEVEYLLPIPNKAPPQLRILAFDIETVFEQTRDPNPNKDEITMISLFTGNDNTLIINSKVVKTEDVRNFDILLRQSDTDHQKPWVDWAYSETSKEFSQVIERFPIKVVIVKTEKALLQSFYQFINDYQPDVLTDFFGGRFDFPFLAVRSEKHKISFEKETGFKIMFKTQRNLSRKDLYKFYSSANIDHVTGAGIIHLDAFLFNEKYSYLPKKDLGLKPSVEKKLKIIPIGREALINITEDPVNAVAYAASDGYITWKYVRELVLDFFISMGQMFPVTASELLTRRAGSLDDLLIDAEGHKHKIIGRRRVGQNDIKSFSPGIVIESLAYTGGLVEAKRPGIWRSDIYYDYKINKGALSSLKEIIQNLIVKESKKLVKEVIKDEFEKRFLASEIGEVKARYSDDPVKFLKQIEVELLKNSTRSQELTKQLEYIRTILEEVSGYHPANVEDVTADILNQIDQLSSLTGKTQLRGVHVDVTSMYPSQIRQYKLQPSGIVNLTMCRICDSYENDDSCFFEGDWVIKLTANRPCRSKDTGPNKCSSSVCTSQNEAKCRKYEPTQNGITRSQEIFTFDGRRTEAYILRDGSNLKKVPINRTYLGSRISKDPFVALQQWLRNSLEATQLITRLDQNHFIIFEDGPETFQLPKNTFMSLDVRTKKLTILLSVNSRVCQKAFNFVARIMDDFFNTRVRHKVELKRLTHVINQKKEQKQSVAPKLLRQQKYHDSTQLGMKVPLNSIYGLLGMKGGVRNASTPCAGITTKLSADLIHWAANQLEQIGLVTELDTDGIWLWVPKLFPLEFPVTIGNSFNENGSKVFKVSLIDKILNERVTEFSKNENYWMNNGETTITRSSKSLIQFEQDGPYDFQFMMGKKKYIVYNYNPRNRTFEEKEIIGLESKRADFSKVQKYFQESIINTYLEQYDPDKPITLEQLYENADREANRIRSEMVEGRMDPSYFVKPKAINKPLRAYKSKLPQVSAAYILKDLGFSVDPGTRIQLLNIKGNQVIPRQIFDFEFEKIKEVLIKHAIATLSFMLGELTTKEDLIKLIDVNQYIEDVFGSGRIYDRMIKYPRQAQQLTKDGTQQELDLSELKTKEIQKITEKSELKEDTKKKLTITEKKKQKRRKTKKSLIKTEKKIKRRKFSKHKKSKPQSLESLFQSEKPAVSLLSTNPTGTVKHKSDKKPIEYKSADKPSSGEIEATSDPLTPVAMVKSAESDDDVLVSSEELQELETNEIFANGLDENNEVDVDAPNEELMVCSECGALVNPQEITNEGCTFCGGQLLNQ